MSDRPLLILDIDETLLHGTKTPLGREAELRVGPFYIYMRPHHEIFLQTMGEHYELAVWSSATRGYLREVMRALMTGQTAPLSFVWDRTSCTRRLDPVELDYFFLKDLKKVKNAGYDLTRVLILEDEPRKVQKHYGNAVYVHPFTGSLEDDELLKLGLYLQGIADTPDFRALEKRNWRVKLL